MKKMEKKKKIAVIGTRGIPATYGGIEKHCEELYSILSRIGYDVTVYSRNYYTDNDLQEHRGIIIKKIPVINIKGFETFIHSFVSTIHATFSDADILHFHAQGPALFSFLPAMFAPKKIIGFTCHGIDWKRDKWSFLARNVIKLGEKASVLFPHVKIGVSGSLSDHYRRNYGIELEKVVNGVEIKPNIILNRTKEKFGVSNKNYFIFVGRLVPEKAPDILIKAFMKLKTDKKLLIVGGSAYTDDYVSGLMKLAQNDERIIFTDYVYGEELQELYSNASAYITASKLEGLPITVLEAMSYSLPCIMSDIPPHNEIYNLDKQAFISFKDQDEEACLGGMEAFLQKTDEEIKYMGERAQNVVKKNFSWEEVASKTDLLYKDALNGVEQALQYD